MDKDTQQEAEQRETERRETELDKIISLLVRALAREVAPKTNTP